MNTLTTSFFKWANFALFAFLTLSCESRTTIDYTTVRPFSSNGNVNAIVEIPAGTNLKIEYNKKEERFEPDRRNGEDRRINFLPYLGNYGFIPSTYSNPNMGGDGDGLDILVLAESTATGTVMETIPIAILKLVDNGEIDSKIIAVPADIDKRIINATTFEEFSSEHLTALNIIEDWFLNYDRTETMRIEGWGDEEETINEIKNSVIQ